MDDKQIPQDAAIVTPSDTSSANGVGLVYAGGTCVVQTFRGNSVTLPAAFAGIVIPLAITKVLLTGTTATSVMVFR